jgi:hypothetical protein
MSLEKQIIDAVLSNVNSVFPKLTVTTEAELVDGRPATDFPVAVIFETEYDIEPLPYRQENRIWIITGSIWIVERDGVEPRDDMRDKLEAVRDVLFADYTLDGLVDSCSIVSAFAESHPDSRTVAGLIAVRAEKVF